MCTCTCVPVCNKKNRKDKQSLQYYDLQEVGGSVGKEDWGHTFLYSFDFWKHVNVLHNKK